jgi:hypothetical protein
MYCFIYKITNSINGRYYIGRHATANIDDNYMGSGKAIKNAIRKYGIENFKKEIITMADTAESLWELEKEIVNDSVVQDPKSYNMAYGGRSYLDGLKKHNPEAFLEHQRAAGKRGGRASISKRDSSWHAKGGSASTKKRAALYRYELITANGELLLLNGLELKATCKERGWNYDTLIWVRHKDRPITSGPLKGFRLTQISKPEKGK